MRNYFTLKLLYFCLFSYLGGYVQAQPLRSVHLTTYAIPFGAQKLKAFDMNNDQKNDLIVMSNAQETAFAIYYGNGDETLSLPANYQKELNFVNFDVADLNKDGHTDLVLSSYWFNGFKTYFGDANQQFTFGEAYNMEAHATGVTISDIDNDGFQDVLGVTSGSGNPVTLNIFKSSENGHLKSSGKYPTLLSGNLNTYVTDKNGDMLSDVMISTRSWLALFYQQTNGVFLLEYWPTDMASVTIGDVNNDKLPDMVLGYTSYDPDNSGDSILVRFGSADSLFSAIPIKLMTPMLHPDDMYLADLNHDNLPDLIINQLNADGRSTDSLFVFRGLGNDGFELSGIYKLPEAIKAFTVADLKNDSFPEIILISDKTLMIMHNSGGLLSATDSSGLSTSNIYPNPLTDWLYIDLPDMTTDIQISDIYGKVQYTSFYTGPIKINTQTLPSGIYIVQAFQNGRLTLVRKINKM